MRKRFARVKSIPFLIWHARHELYHVLIGLVWAWVLREIWHEFNPRWIMLSVFASLLPDLDHIIYFLGNGRADEYSVQIKNFLKNKQWRILISSLEIGHKYNTNLRYHNYYTMIGLILLTAGSFLYDWNTGVILFGAMFLHYAFDIWDDILTLGYVNPNWKRWGLGKRATRTTLE